MDGRNKEFERVPKIYKAKNRIRAKNGKKFKVKKCKSEDTKYGI